jgi:hypothetical protein
MLPEIGIMMGLYILTRYLSFFTRKGDRAESSAVITFASVAFIVTVIIIIDLMVRAFTSTPLSK